MYFIKKVFEVPISHRLSKHTKACKFFHGHNLKLEVTMRSEILDNNDMVMDFSELKQLVNSYLETWDHGLFINQCDEKLFEDIPCKKHILSFDPTSEILCRMIFYSLGADLSLRKRKIYVDEVAIWETENSKSWYREN